MSTRVAGLGRRGKHEKSVFLPVFDLINHGMNKNVELESITINQKLGYEVRALRNIKKGEEIFTQYGVYNDYALLQR